ncbi:hypothetical protein [Idiomarina sp. HP20-50]|uniref:hypothetical protein n=1 Tax=Idiomarina sp. HP20-50 TaxID=3070813 RepID=UPI00294B77B5|nr:hypothetical protein [Idiomarina sp. HP20-50]MDV6316462.1 hypothetical protein [Idiomarina sp. HP20-50]
MNFDLYTDFIAPMYGENKELFKSVTALIKKLQANKVKFCFAGDLPFSLHCVRQMTTDMDIFISELDWQLLEMSLLRKEADGHISIKENVRPFDDKAEAFSFTINLIKISATQWKELTVENTLSAFKIDNLPAVAQLSLIPMVNILKSRRSFSSSEDSFFKARLAQAKEKQETGEVGSGYIMSWGELQALKKKRFEGH